MTLTSWGLRGFRRARVCATVFMVLVASHLSRDSKQRLPEARTAAGQRSWSNLGEGNRYRGTTPSLGTSGKRQMAATPRKRLRHNAPVIYIVDFYH